MYVFLRNLSANDGLGRCEKRIDRIRTFYHYRLGNGLWLKLRMMVIKVIFVDSTERAWRYGYNQIREFEQSQFYVRGLAVKEIPGMKKWKFGSFS